MWRCRRRRGCFVILALMPIYLSSHGERMAQRCSGLSTAAGAVSITDCAGLEALPAPIAEDLRISFDGVEAVVCDKVRSECAPSPFALASHALCFVHTLVHRTFQVPGAGYQLACNIGACCAIPPELSPTCRHTMEVVELGSTFASR